MPFRCANTISHCRRPFGLLATLWLVMPAISLAQTPADSQPTTSQPTSARILLLYSDQTSTAAAVKATQNALADKGFQCLPIVLPTAGSAPDKDTAQASADALAKLKDPTAAAIVAVGPVAAHAARRASTQPIVATMIPDALDTPLADDDAQRVTLTIDIDPDRLIATMQQIQNPLTHIAILTSSRSQKTAEAIRQAGQKKNVTVTVIAAARNAFGATLATLTASPCDAVLMLPDGQIYNSVTVRELLLWGLRQKRAVWAFSDNLVKAGAFAAIATTPQAIADQTAEIVTQRLTQGAKTPPLTYANAFEVSLNHRTAQMIGQKPSDDALRTVTRHHGKK